MARLIFSCVAWAWCYFTVQNFCLVKLSLGDGLAERAFPAISRSLFLKVTAFAVFAGCAGLRLPHAVPYTGFKGLCSLRGEAFPVWEVRKRTVVFITERFFRCWTCNWWWATFFVPSTAKGPFSYESFFLLLTIRISSFFSLFSTLFCLLETDPKIGEFLLFLMIECCYSARNQVGSFFCSGFCDWNSKGFGLVTMSSKAPSFTRMGFSVSAVALLFGSSVRPRTCWAKVEVGIYIIGVVRSKLFSAMLTLYYSIVCISGLSELWIESSELRVSCSLDALLVLYVKFVCRIFFLLPLILGLISHMLSS